MIRYTFFYLLFLCVSLLFSQEIEETAIADNVVELDVLKKDALNVQYVEKTVTDTSAVVKPRNVVDFLKNSEEHKIFYKFLEAAEMDEDLSKAESFTVFAPTDSAFEKLPKATIDTLLLPENKEKLKALIRFHMLNESVNVSEMSKNIEANNNLAKYKTANGNNITIYIKHGIITIQGNKGKGSFIEKSDKKQHNGYVHIVDTVFIPY